MGFKGTVYSEKFKDRDGHVLNGHVQVLAYLIWTSPERGFQVRDMHAILNKVVGLYHGSEVSRSMSNAFARHLIRINAVTRGFWGRSLHLSDSQMETRQRIVFRLGFRDTVLDKMPRIKARHDTNTPYRKLPEGGLHGYVLSHEQILSSLRAEDLHAAISEHNRLFSDEAA